MKISVLLDLLDMLDALGLSPSPNETRIVEYLKQYYVNLYA